MTFEEHRKFKGDLAFTVLLLALLVVVGYIAGYAADRTKKAFYNCGKQGHSYEYCEYVWQNGDPPK